MSNSRKQLMSSEISKITTQLDEDTAKEYLYEILSIINDQNKPHMLNEELDKLFYEIMQSSVIKGKSITNQNNSSPRKRLNIPLAKVGPSNKQKKLKAENDKIIRGIYY